MDVLGIAAKIVAKKYNEVKLQPVSIEGIEFDALISEDKDYTATIPTYPVEEGFPVSDTIVNDPISVKMTLVLTPTPVTWMIRHGILHGYIRVQNILKQLEELYMSKKLVKVVTSDTMYTDMGITSMSIHKSKESGYGRQVDVTFQKVRVTSRQTTDIPDDVVKSGQTEADAGAAATSEEPEGGNYDGGENTSDYGEDASDYSGDSSSDSSSGSSESGDILGAIFGRA